MRVGGLGPDRLWWIKESTIHNEMSIVLALVEEKEFTWLSYIDEKERLCMNHRICQMRHLSKWHPMWLSHMDLVYMACLLGLS